MAGSSSLTPKPVSPSRVVRRFTLQEANRTLPLVQRIAGDIVKTQQRVADLEAALAEAPAKDQPAIQAALNHAGDRFQGYVQELRNIGCQLKDYKNGLIDFLSRYQDRDIYLCWKLGEQHIEYWHEISAGYAGRQPVSALGQGE
jgi:hypothetical protein